MFSSTCFFFNDPATTEIYTLSLHDALPISPGVQDAPAEGAVRSVLARDAYAAVGAERVAGQDRKSTRLNSSHTVISYAVFCLKKKNFRTAAFSKLHVENGMLVATVLVGRNR